MSPKKKISILIVWILICSSNGFAQKKSSDVISEEDSIVYIYEKPYVVNQTITQKEDFFNHWFIQVSGSEFSYKNFHRICGECSEYKSEIKKSIHTSISYAMGVNLMYVPSKVNLVYSLGISYTSFHENFEHKNDSSFIIKAKNEYNYLDLNLGLGYWIFRKRAISFMLAGELIGSKLTVSRGKTLDYTDVFKVLDNSVANRDAGWVLSGKAGIKAIFFNDRRVKFFIEPFTRFNMTSALKYKKNYYLDRWVNGLEVGLIYVL